MNPQSPGEIEDEILNQAALWCMCLQDETCTSEERLAFQEWIQLDPRHAFEYAKMLEIWDLSDQLPANPGTSKKLLTEPSARRDGMRKM
ncbi:FecR/PupR family sigma factor regulator [Pseudomonas sp. NPDC087346]|uniref:FecR/PupR family sigma factor regulator n=1 Tax=Pseudomonas sp. NPDC087346 TaxID=3364438 RepID=UPI00381DF0B0